MTQTTMERIRALDPLALDGEHMTETERARRVKAILDGVGTDAVSMSDAICIAHILDDMRMDFSIVILRDEFGFPPSAMSGIIPECCDDAPAAYSYSTEASGGWVPVCEECLEDAPALFDYRA